MIGVIKIDDELFHVTNIFDGGYLPMIETEEGQDFYLAENSETAGEKAVKHWQEMLDNDPKEFTCIIGEERLVLWATSQCDSFGICGFEDFKEKVAEVPEEEWASYDHQEREIDSIFNQHHEKRHYICSPTIIEELGFVPTVAYRHN